MTSTTMNTIDVRTIAPPERHRLIFGRFEALGADEALELVNDHDPRPLHHQFNSRFPGGFDWTYLQSGPELWRVQIGKRATAGTARASEGSCCSGGACGG